LKEDLLWCKARNKDIFISESRYLAALALKCSGFVSFETWSPTPGFWTEFELLEEEK